MNEYTKVNWQDGTVLQPAKVTIDGTDYDVTPAVESGTTPVNATNLDKMDTALKQAHDSARSMEINKIDKATIELLTVDSTAPEHCSEGDMYYNTTTNYIYTATGTDTWGSTGALPSSKYLYVDLSNSKLYYYDGTNFTSYGGGASNDVIISDTQPTSEDNKIWIDTGEVGSAVSEITNEYSTSTGKGYSANYINNNVGIVDSGSNVNGNYIKFADGTMICYAILPFNLAITNQYEGVYYANTDSIIFPQEFISTPVINIMLRGIAGGGYSFYNVLTSEFSGFVWKIQSKTSDFSLLYPAIGRWK